MDPKQTGPNNEEEIVRLIASLAGEASDELRVGIGDDCAVLSLGAQTWCVTTDLLVEGVHFDRSFITPYDLGRRAMAANLSDLAAMGADPRWGFLSLGIGPEPISELLEGVIRGVSGMGHEYGLALAGGDTVRSPALLLNLCLMGRLDKDTAALRTGARQGDAVCVTGSLGASAGGLAWLKTGGPASDPVALDLVEAHLRPRPRVLAGRALCQSKRIHAMIDISDGLGTDLARLCQASQAGAEVAAAKLPVHPDAPGVAAHLGQDALEWALSGGEDFELLFTCDPSDVELLTSLADEAEPGLTVHQVGSITKGPGVTLIDPLGDSREISFMGYDHFRPKE